MGRSYKADTTYIKQKGKTPYDSLHLPASQPQIAETLHFTYKNLGFLQNGLLAPKMTLGDSVPIGPQHKYGDSPRVTLLV